MDFLAALVLAAVTASPPDFSLSGNLNVLAPGGGMNESTVAASGNRVVVAVMNPTTPGFIDVFASADGGITWSDRIDMPMSIDGKTYSYAADPSLTVLDDGSFGLAYLVVTNAPSPSHAPLGAMGLAYVRSVDGVTWAAPVMLVSGTASVTPLADKPWLSVDRIRGIVYLAWTRSGESSPQEIVYARSADRGATWSAPVVVTPPGAETGAQIGALSNGTLVMTNFDALNHSFVSRASADGGASFGDPQTLGPDAGTFTTSKTKTASSPFQTLAVFGDDLYCVYPAMGHVFFTRSVDGAKSWSRPLQLGGPTDQAVMPSIAVNDASGEIVVAWLDNIDDTTTMRLYATRSTDGGASFEAARPFSPPFAAGGRLGDYNGTAIVANGAAVTAFSPEGGYLTAARLVFTPATRRRAVSH